jgi:hypothetical protein
MPHRARDSAQAMLHIQDDDTSSDITAPLSLAAMSNGVDLVRNALAQTLGSAGRIQHPTGLFRGTIHAHTVAFSETVCQDAGFCSLFCHHAFVKPPAIVSDACQELSGPPHSVTQNSCAVRICSRSKLSAQRRSGTPALYPTPDTDLNNSRRWKKR